MYTEDVGPGEAQWNPPDVAGSETRPSGQIGSELRDLPDGITGITEAIHKLEKRLEGVLRPVEDTDKVAGDPRPVYVPIAEELVAHNGALRAARARLVSILDRLEL